MTDQELLHDYAANGSESSFTQLVQRHVDWVWSAARRQVPGPLTEDVTQAVFVVLAKKAAALNRGGKPLVPWLFKVIRYTSSQARRGEARRHHHEQKAAAMKSETIEPTTQQAWMEIAPYLDDLVNRLSKSDRLAVLLRFYQGKSLAEVGQALGATEEAARKRVSRAVDKLRQMLAGRGIHVAGGALLATLLPGTTTAAPAGLVKPPTAIAGSTAALAGQTLQMMAAIKLKLAAACLVGFMTAGAGSAIVATSVLRAQSATAPATAPASSPLLGVDDLIEVDITDLVGPGIVTRVPRRIDPGGFIAVPILRRPLSIAGLTPAQAEEAIAVEYTRANLIRNATVAVRRLELGAEATAPSRALEPGDYVRVMIGDLDGPGQERRELLQLSEAGTVRLPLIGELKVAGLTGIEAERAISGAYRDRNLIRDATVWVLRISPEEAKAELEKKP